VSDVIKGMNRKEFAAIMMFVLSLTFFSEYNTILSIDSSMSDLVPSFNWFHLLLELR